MENNQIRGLNLVRIRSSRDSLDGYVILPRLIDKVRLHAYKKLSPEYVENLLKPGLTLDGRFLTFTGLDGEALRSAILTSENDEAVLAWVEKNAKPRSEKERQQWVASIDAYRPNPEIIAYRKATYPELAFKMDIVNISPLDLIDIDEHRK